MSYKSKDYKPPTFSQTDGLSDEYVKDTLRVKFELVRLVEQIRKEYNRVEVEGEEIVDDFYQRVCFEKNAIKSSDTEHKNMCMFLDDLRLAIMTTHPYI